MVARTDILVDVSEEELEENNSDRNPASDAIVSWILANVNDWQDYRDNNYKKRWDEYYRIWRGIWNPSDKTRDSERSKLISPATQQAVEAIVSELEEATFGKGKWFDLSDDVIDQNKEDAYQVRELLYEDMEKADFPSAISVAYLNGALYGNGIGKIIVDTDKEQYLTESGEVVEQERIIVKFEAISPKNFVIDPAAKSIEEALGCAHIIVKPKHEITGKQLKGIYRDIDIGDYIDDEDVSALGETTSILPRNKVKIIEYYGLIPRELFEAFQEGEVAEDEILEDLNTQIENENDLIEVIATIANDSALLRLVENPYMMKDRPFVSYQHDTVPDRFWGRGIVEKAYNSQKALDAEMRARIDGLALSTHPMMGVDATKLPRGMRLTVKPGNTLLTNGPPKDVLMPFNFGNVNQATFHQSGELERLVQMATGAFDSATPITINPRNQTASGMSMIASAAIKRSKRTMQNIERNFLVPLINKVYLRYVQFYPEKYPAQDLKFIPHSAMGIVAREFEQTQLTQLLNTVPPDSPAYWMIIRGIFDNSSISNKDKVIPLVDQLLQQTLNPPPSPPDPAIEIKAKELELKAQEAQMIHQREMQRLAIEAERARTEQANMVIKQQELEIKRGELELDSIKTQADSILSLAKAEAEEVGSQIDALKAQVEALGAASQEIFNKSDEFKATLDSVSMEEKESVSEDIINKLEELMEQNKEINKKLKELENKQPEKEIIIKEMQKEGMLENIDNSDEIKELENKIDSLASMLKQHIQQMNAPKKIERDKFGRVISVNGKPVKRNEQGLIEEV